MKPKTTNLHSQAASIYSSRPDKSVRHFVLLGYILFYGLLLGGLFASVIFLDNLAQYLVHFSLQHPWLNKLGHAAIHAGLTLILYLSIRRLSGHEHGSSSLLLALLISALLGVLHETQQLLIPDKSFSSLDMLANLSGSISAVILIHLYHRPRWVPALALAAPVAMMLLVTQHDIENKQFYNAGLIYMSNKDYVRAHDMFQQALAQGKGHGTLYNELAWLELEHLDLDPQQALQYTRRAVAEQPQNADFLDTHGWALFKNHRYDDALRFLKKSYQLNYQGYCINYHLGAVYHALGMQDEARYYLQAQLSHSQGDRFAQKSRSLLEIAGLVMSTH